MLTPEKKEIVTMYVLEKKSELENGESADFVGFAELTQAEQVTLIKQWRIEKLLEVEARIEQAQQELARWQVIKSKLTGF